MNAGHIDLLHGTAVIDLFRDDHFRAELQQLYDACPWATVGQRPDFLRIWLDHYGSQFEPLMALSRNRDGVLDGILPLVRADDAWRFAGFLDSEYGVWLARPESSDAFIRAAIARVQKYANLRIVLFYLPHTTQLEWARRPSLLLPYLELEEQARLVVPLRDAASVASWVKKRSRLRTARNKLARTGNVSFRRVRDVAEIAVVLDRFAAMLDVRKGAAFGITTFRDDLQKRPFLLAQAAVPDLLHVTVLERDGELLAAHVNTSGTRELGIGGLAHTEFEAQFSPGSLLLFELVQLAAAEGFELVDFTPGADDYKARFAKDTQPVYRLTVHSSLAAAAKARLRHEARKAKRAAVAAIATRAEAQPGGWAARISPWIERLRPQPPAEVAPRLARAVCTVSLNSRTDATQSAALPAGWRRNNLEDITRFRGSRESYLALMRQLTAAARAGGALYTCTNDDVLCLTAILLPAHEPPVATVAGAGDIDFSEPTWTLSLACSDPSCPHERKVLSLRELVCALPIPQQARLQLSTPDVDLAALVTAVGSADGLASSMPESTKHLRDDGKRSARAAQGDPASSETGVSTILPIER